MWMCPVIGCCHVEQMSGYFTRRADKRKRTLVLVLGNFCCKILTFYCKWMIFFCKFLGSRKRNCCSVVTTTLLQCLVAVVVIFVGHKCFSCFFTVCFLARQSFLVTLYCYLWRLCASLFQYLMTYIPIRGCHSQLHHESVNHTFSIAPNVSSESEVHSGSD